MSFARIDIIDRARVRMGSGPLQSEGAPGADVAIAIYDDVLRLLVSLKPFSCARRIYQLVRVDPLPQPAFRKYRYKLPSERLGPPLAVFKERAGERGPRPFTDWELEGDCVLTDAEEVWAQVPILPAPETWHPLLREAVILACAAEFAIVIRQDEALAEGLRRRVYGDDRVPGDIGLLQKAATADAQSQPSTVMQIDGGPLVSVRQS